MKKLIVVFLFIISVMGFGKDIILLQGAMDMEIDVFIKALEGKKEKQINGFKFWTGKIGNKDVVVSKTEVGMINATISTMIALENFKPIAIINQGTSGGHDLKLHTFDIVLGEKSFNMGAFKSNRLEIGEGSKPNKWVNLPDPMTIPKDGKMKKYKYFEGNKDLLVTAEKVKYTHGKVVRGVIGTADQWNRELDRIEHLNKMYGSSTEEMETSAVAQVAEVYGVPFLGVRILSNIEIHEEEFAPKSGAYCQNYVVEIVKAIK